MPAPGSSIENHTHRLLQRMQAEHSAAMSAITKQLDAAKGIMGSLGGIHDKRDTIAVEIAQVRADMERGFRVLQGDIVTLEGQNISRQIEILEAVRREDAAEDRFGQTIAAAP